MIMKLLLSMILTFGFVYADFPSPQDQVTAITDEDEQNQPFDKPDLDISRDYEDSENQYSTLKRGDNGELDHTTGDSDLGKTYSKPVDEITFNAGKKYYLGGQEVTPEEWADWQGPAYVVYKINNTEVTSIDYMNERDDSTTTQSSVEYFDNPHMKIMYFVDGVNKTLVDYNNNVSLPSAKKYYIDNVETDKQSYYSHKEEKADTNYNNMLTFYEDSLKDVNAEDTVNKSFLNAPDQPTTTNDFGEQETRENLYKAHHEYEMDKMTNDYIAGQHPLDPRVNDANKISNFREELKAKWSNMFQDSIKCSITRKLIPSYVCPYLDRNTITYGGTVQESVLEKKEECEENCTEEYTCMAKEIEGATVATEEGEAPADVIEFTIDDLTPEADYTLEGTANSVQSTKEVIYKFKGQWKETYENQLRDVNGEYLYGLKPDRIYYDVKMKYPDNDWGNHLNRASIPTSKPDETASESEKVFEAELRLPINAVMEGTRIKIYPHQDLDLEELHLESITFVYEDSDMWFCPERQEFNPTLLNCNDGTVKVVDLKNGLRMKICVSKTAKMGPEINYGAFYSQESCLNSCYRKKRCEPSYRHFRTSSLDKQNFFEIDVNCYDLENNTQCTKELCEQYINQNIDVLNEWNLNSKDKMEQVVSFGILVDGKTRPKVDLTRETINESSTDEEIRELEIATQKDVAYLDMVQQQSFNFISKPIGESTLIQNAYEKESSENGSRFSWIVKPRSADYDKQMYLYSIIEFDQMFYPKYGTYVMPDNLNSGTRIVSNDPLMQIKDRTYMIKESTGNFKVFRKIENSHFYVLENVLDESTNPPEVREIRTWKEASAAYYNDRIVEYVGGEMQDTAGSTQAPYFDTVTPGFDRAMTEYRYLISEELTTDITDVPGGLMREQLTDDHGQSMIRSYEGDFDSSSNEMYRGTLDGMKVYSFYSDTPLTYNEVIDRLTDENAVYDVKGAFLYNQEIKGDQEYITNMKLFKQGDAEKTTIHLDLQPHEKEVGKRGFIFMFLY